MNNIQQIASKFNQEHGRAMTFNEALLEIHSQYETELFRYRETAELYAESVKQFERTKVIEELHNCIMVQWEKDFGSIHDDMQMDAYTVSGFVKSALKSHPLDTNEK